MAGRQASLTLFEEYNDGSVTAIYVLEEFHQKFLEERDLTEYKPAIELVGSWKEWERLKRDSSKFKNFVSEWKDELEVLLRSEALKKITDIVVNGKDQASLSAAKFIAQHGYNKLPVGRPNQEQIKMEARELAQRNSETSDEAKRIEEALNIHVIEGGKV